MAKLPKHQCTCDTGKAKFLALERTLKEWVNSQRAKISVVTSVVIHLKAKELAKQTNVAKLFGGLSWCSRFMASQNHLSVCARTTVGLKLLDDQEEKVVNFRKFVSQRKEELGIQADRVFNINEGSMSFDAAHSRTVDLSGAENEPVSTTGHEKTCFTVVLANRTLLLIFDSFSVHILTTVIPGGLTKKLQLLYFSVKCSFKNHIRAKWEKWVSEGINTLVETIVVSLLFCEYILAAPQPYHIRIFFHLFQLYLNLTKWSLLIA